MPCAKRHVEGSDLEDIDEGALSSSVGTEHEMAHVGGSPGSMRANRAELDLKSIKRIYQFPS